MSKNLIFIVVDDLRKDFIFNNTNGFKKFAYNGTVLNQLITHSPETFLSIGTHLTGLYPFKHKSGCEKFDNIYSMFDYLRPTHKLFMQAYYPPFGQSYTINEYQDNFGYIGEKISRETMGAIPDISLTLDFIRNIKEQKFVYLHFFTLRFLEDILHSRVDYLCENNRISEVMAAYKEAVLRVDAQILRLWELIKNNLDEYLVVITADHGESFKLYDNHNLGDSGAAWMLHNGSRYEESINIPMIICGLDTEQDKVANKQIRQIDIFPTLAKKLDIKLEKQIDGEAIELDDDKIIEKPIFICKTSETLKRALRTQDYYKLIYNLDSVELYDLKNDYKEQNDLSKLMTGNVIILRKLAEDFFIQEDFTKRDIILKYVGWERLDDNWSIMKKRFRELNIDDWFNKAENYNKILGVSSDQYISDIANMMKLDKTSKVLEVGIGTGAVSSKLLNFSNNVYGVDVSPSMLALTDKRIKTYIGLADRLSFLDETFDVVFGRQIYHNLTEYFIQSLKEAKRVLKQNGKFIIAEFIPPEDSLVDEWTNLRVNKEKRVYLKFQEIIDSMHDNGFNNIESYRNCIKQASLRNWLNNWCASIELKNEVDKRFRNASVEYKKSANFIYTQDNDILFDMHYGIVCGSKNGNL